MNGLSLVYALAAVCGLVAAGYWFKVATSLDTIGEGAARSSKRVLGFAATATGLAFVLAGGGFLIGLLSGS